MAISIIGILIYFIVLSSLIVTQLSSKDSKSTVKAYGIPHSSVLAYLFPTDTPESSIFEESPEFVKSYSLKQNYKLNILLTYFINFFCENRLTCQWQYRAFDRCYCCWKVEVCSLYIILSHSETMFKNTIHYSSKSIWWLNNMRNKFLF